jgi:hypothetical protein
MGSLSKGVLLIPLILSLSSSISLGQVERDPREKDIKNLFFNPKVGSDEIKRVVVLPIHSEEEGLRYAPGITDLLVKSLRTVGKYDMLPTQDLKGLVEERGMDWIKIHHYTQALGIGKSLGVDGVLMGSLSEYGSMGGRAQFGLNLRMMRIPEGDIAWSMSCSTREKPKEMRSIANKGIESIIRTLVHAWKSDRATIAWGINLQPLKASGRRRKIKLRVPKYRETEIEEYIVTRSTAESGPYKVIKRFSMGRKASLSFNDKDAQGGFTYFYRYRVLTKEGFLSPFSTAVEASVRKRKAPARP